jgi:CID domain
MSLHDILSQVDMSHPRITAGAAAMMKHYDRSVDTAVTEWRNALQSCREDQLLPLLYVANETLQNSKRNRGNKFLEAFSTVLGQSLQYMCQRSPTVVEKVRRTAKIWGDRRVFSIRFVTEVLKGLEGFRHTLPADSAPKSQKPQLSSAFDRHNSTDDESDAENRFSPPTRSYDDLPDPVPAQSNSNLTSRSPRTEVTVSPTVEDLMRESSDDDDDDDSVLADNSSPFGFGSSKPSLQITIDTSQLVEDATATSRVSKQRPVKRRRSSTTSKKRKAILSTQSLQELWNQLATLQQQYDQSLTLLQGIADDHLSLDNVSDMMGEEVLVEAYSENIKYRRLVQAERGQIHRVAKSKRLLEQEALHYLPWCQTALLQDDEDLESCAILERDLSLLQLLHEPAQAERRCRNDLLAKAERRRALEQRRREEEEERKRMLEASLAKQEEAQPGMVWNKATQEYQYLNTEESWRD